MAIGIHIYKRLPDIIQGALFSGDTPLTVVGLDIKSFDATVQPRLIHTAFHKLSQNLIFPDIMSEYAFEYTIQHFINRPVIMPDGRIWLKRVGVPSGSYYTQMIDSVVNLIATYYAQLSLQPNVYNRTFTTFVLGDDSIFGIPTDLGYPDPTMFEPHFKELGLTLSPTKSIVANRASELKFLGHVARGTRVDRDSATLLRLALYQEQPVSGPAMSITRITGLLIDSALCSWPLIHLYQTMHAKYRHQ